LEIADIGLLVDKFLKFVGSDLYVCNCHATDCARRRLLQRTIHALSSGERLKFARKEYFLFRPHNASARNVVVKFRQSVQLDSLIANENFYQ
jgi:hypothetical protein